MMSHVVQFATTVIVVPLDYAHELHHASVFVREDVAVEDIGADEISESVTNPYAARDEFPVIILAGSRDVHDIAPDQVVLGFVSGIAVGIENLHDLKWIDVNVERMRNGGFVRQQPVFHITKLHTLVGSFTIFAKLF